MTAYIIDALVLLAYFGLILGIGLSQRSKSGSMEGFTLGDRQIAWWAVLASILAAEISAGTFFGAPGEGYALRNYTYIQLMAGYLLARVVVSAFFIPAYYRHNVVSVYEFLEIRFGPRTRRISSAVFLVTRLLASGSRLWVPTVLLVLGWKVFIDPQTTPMQAVNHTQAALVRRVKGVPSMTNLDGVPSKGPKRRQERKTVGRIERTSSLSSTSRTGAAGFRRVAAVTEPPRDRTQQSGRQTRHDRASRSDGRRPSPATRR